MWIAFGLACTSSTLISQDKTKDSSQEPNAVDTADTGELVTPINCEDLEWTYENVGEPFMAAWCTHCHSSELAEGERSGAPIAVNLDTLTGIRAWIPYILNRIYNPTTPMPPMGDPPEDELQRVADWLRCDAP